MKLHRAQLNGSSLVWVFHASSIKALDVGKLEVTLGAAEGFISEWFIPSVGYFMRLQHIFTDLRSLKFACVVRGVFALAATVHG